MATETIKQAPNLVDQFAEILLTKFDIGPDFLKEITNKALAIAKKTTQYNFSKRLKEGGLFGIGKDAITALAKRSQTKEPPIVKDTLEAASLKRESKTVEEVTGKDASLPGPANKLGDESTPDLLQEDIKPTTILFGGFTAEGEKQLREKLPDFFEEVFKKLPKKEEKIDDKKKFGEDGLLGKFLPKGLLGILGGAGLILGGLAALVGGFMTQGPAKGVLELIGKAGLQGGLKMVAKKIFTKSLEKVLTKIPIIGSLISFGFAIQRFMNGDITGGFLSLAAGLVNLIPGVGFVLGIGIDIIQAILDAKTGGSNPEASAKKSGLLLQWAKGLGDIIWNGIKYVPVIGPLIDAIDSMIKGEWLDAGYNLVRAIPGLGTVMDLVNYFSEGAVEETVKGGLSSAGAKILEWGSSIAQFIWNGAKKLPIIGPLIDATNSLFEGNWFEVLWNLARINPLFEPMVGVFEALTGSNVKEGAQVAVGNISNLLDGIKNYFIEKAKKVFSWALNIGEKFSSGDYGGAILSIAKLIPGMGWLINLFGEQNVSGALTQAVSTQVTAAKSMFSFFGKIKDLILKKILNLLPESILGISVRSRVAGLLGIDMGAVNDDVDSSSQIENTPSIKETLKDKTDKKVQPEQPVPLADGGVVTKPTNALVGEAGHEAVIPIEKYLNPESFSLNNEALSQIASNTETTNEGLKGLTQAIFKLAEIFNEKSTANNNIFINGKQQEQPLPSASQIAASNRDPIRQVRAQFAV